MNIAQLSVENYIKMATSNADRARELANLLRDLGDSIDSEICDVMGRPTASDNAGNLTLVKDIVKEKSTLQVSDLFSASGSVFSWIADPDQAMRYLVKTISQ